MIDRPTFILTAVIATIAAYLLYHWHTEHMILSWAILIGVQTTAGIGYLLTKKSVKP